MSRTRKTNAAPGERVEAMSPTAECTERIGEILGALLEPGMALALHGELGSGKTTFMHGITAGAGGDSAAVKSPTFVLVREYAGRVPVVHVDGYRLSGALEAAWLDMDLIFAPDKVTAIEWPEKFENLLPDDRLEIVFTHVSTHRRRLSLSGTGPRSQAVVSAARPAIEAAIEQLRSEEQLREAEPPHDAEPPSEAEPSQETPEEPENEDAPAADSGDSGASGPAAH